MAPRSARVSLQVSHDRAVVLVEDDGRGGAHRHPTEGWPGSPSGPAPRTATFELSSPPGGPTVARTELPVRIVIADDSVLLREGMQLLLAEAGHDVVAAVGDGPRWWRRLSNTGPDLCVVDVRMPPSHTDEGLRAVVEVRRAWPEARVIVLSQYVELSYAEDLLADGGGGIGYLLKDRVSDIEDFLDAVERVAAGGTVIDPIVVSQLIARRRDPLAALTPRETGGAGPDGGGPLERRDRRGDDGHRGRGGEVLGPRLRQAGAAPRRERTPPGAGRAAAGCNAADTQRLPAPRGQGLVRPSRR